MLLLVISAVVLLSRWLVDSVESRMAGEERKVSHTPDYYLENFAFTAMDTTGAPEYRLIADLMQHFPDDDTVALTSPQMTFYRDAERPWHAQAETATVFDDGERIHLFGTVTMRQEVSPPELPVVVTTRDVRMRPREQYAETDAPVNIVRGPDTIDAVGARVFLDEGIVELLSSARGRYAMPRP